ncbi:MAG TPA: metalloprotease PmbA [Candidatus Tenderia electrophaga]|uniref:Metalloprotease PmbA n=1 Tax=Candidatus Tenderia electrophaga TaxID=1748243 RepID=A0A832J7A4_9GAMM|nr:metalloprotease PmbA [Candidatus Tenderia electrophaga]
MANTPVIKNSVYSQDQLEALVEQILAEAGKLGATAAEAALSIESGLSVNARMGEVETVEHNHDKGLGVTVYFGQSKGSSSTSDFSDAAIRDTVAAACRIARYTAADEYSGLADAGLMARDVPDLDLIHPWQLSPERAIELALESEDAARGYDPRIVNSDGASVSSHHSFRVYGNSHGFVGAFGGTRHSMSCCVVGQEPGNDETMQRDYWYTSSRDACALEAPEIVGHKAAERTIKRLGARRIKTCQTPVIFAAEQASGLISSFLSAIRGGAQYRRSSFLLDCAGEQVFPDFMQIDEQPLLLRGQYSSPFDREGVATCNRDLIKDGVVQGYILDSYAARRLKLQTTANAGGTRNVFVSHGSDDLHALCRQMDTGLLITDMMGQGTNMVTGDYSRGAAGFWVENGVIQYPVEELTVAGNLKQMFKDIVAVANDVDARGNICTGSILVENMTVAGE